MKFEVFDLELIDMSHNQIPGESCSQIVESVTVLCNCKRCAVARLGQAERAASVVRLQAAELVKWRFRHGQVLASLTN